MGSPSFNSLLVERLGFEIRMTMSILHKHLIGLDCSVFLNPVFIFVPVIEGRLLHVSRSQCSAFGPIHLATK